MSDVVIFSVGETSMAAMSHQLRVAVCRRDILADCAPWLGDECTSLLELEVCNTLHKGGGYAPSVIEDIYVTLVLKSCRLLFSKEAILCLILVRFGLTKMTFADNHIDELVLTNPDVCYSQFATVFL
ncbi:hypothetical protein E2C01_038295 [Portunus trituberculatus]|uniref:Uncharacterized protein n=1 Tax=Portunus trituberculatus TaxID=210409 RepID=A0A5B7FI61_PORTR|nr:hypothetical protein [Portunus trituberculatus]